MTIIQICVYFLVIIAMSLFIASLDLEYFFVQFYLYKIFICDSEKRYFFNIILFINLNHFCFFNYMKHICILKNFTFVVVL